MDWLTHYSQMRQHGGSIDKLLAHLLRCCHYLCAQFDITVTAEHIQGKVNSAADVVPLFHLSVPQADQQPSIAPHNWIMNSTPDWLSPCWRNKLQHHEIAANTQKL